jgi:ParB-like chromosome segregation protein Spo0J
VPASNPEANAVLIRTIEGNMLTEVQKALKAGALVKEKDRLRCAELSKWCLNLPHHSDGYKKRIFSKQDKKANFQILQALLKAGG